MGLLKTAATVAVASSVHGRIQRRQQQRWAAQDQHRRTAALPGPGTATASLRRARLATAGTSGPGAAIRHE